MSSISRKRYRLFSLYYYYFQTPFEKYPGQISVVFAYCFFLGCFFTVVALLLSMYSVTSSTFTIAREYVVWLKMLYSVQWKCSHFKGTTTQDNIEIWYILCCSRTWYAGQIVTYRKLSRQVWLKCFIRFHLYFLWSNENCESGVCAYSKITHDKKKFFFVCVMNGYITSKNVFVNCWVGATPCANVCCNQSSPFRIFLCWLCSLDFLCRHTCENEQWNSFSPKCFLMNWWPHVIELFFMHHSLSVRGLCLW